MAINIKDPETDRLARELAALTGEPITVALRGAIRARLDELRRRAASAPSHGLAEVMARGRQRQLRDDRTEAEILGYGDDGLPA